MLYRLLAQGGSLLSVWPPGADKRLGPAPASGTQPHGDTYPVLGQSYHNSSQSVCIIFISSHYHNMLCFSFGVELTTLIIIN